MGKVADNTLARSLEALYQEEFVHKFPLKDCSKLQKLHPHRFHSLAPDLNVYFMFIAGYSSSATRIAQRPEAEIRTAIPRLKRSFYDIFPQYEPLSQDITDVNTPSLSHDLEVADRLRIGLVTLMSELL